MTRDERQEAAVRGAARALREWAGFAAEEDREDGIAARLERIADCLLGFPSPQDAQPAE